MEITNIPTKEITGEKTSEPPLIKTNSLSINWFDRMVACYASYISLCEAREMFAHDISFYRKFYRVGSFAKFY